ncbi:hypothetical protein D6851_05830 [Altericroceibacterium spongiae]|uniref:Methyltransferase n=1 Tax=Altericroceibacterium spongiae TaxID=2320269 RepID=A0A420EPW8_9SPHN|nr:class I SAM-dependent methyltransferase [Altericroceibacterium spongiae]RKF22718.1 hypothetical protein D6851_05830 [Altericroceibacterium spongiae]
MRRIFASTIVAAGLCWAGPALADQTDMSNSVSFEDVLTQDFRAKDSIRDQYRHPAETLSFFQVKPGMTVVDFMPSGGWYTRVLVPYLGEDGIYIGLDPEVPSDATGFLATMRDTASRVPQQAAEWLGDEGAEVRGANVGSIPEEWNGTVDRVMIFREIHNMHRRDWLRPALVAARKLLKEDGMVGVVQHRAKADASAEYTDGNKGYLREQDVIALFQANGFDLVASSEVNANLKDTANYPGGVWTLPPTYAGAEEADKARLQTIGESDRMTLLFRKRP